MRIVRRAFYRATTLILLGSSIASAQAIEAEWVNAVDGSWTDPIFWSTDPDSPNNGSPATTDLYNVLIGAVGAPYTVLLDVDTSISRLGLSSSEATLRLQSSTLGVSGDTSIAGGDIELGNSTLNVNSLSLAVGPVSFLQLDSSTLNATGDVSLTGGSILANNSTLNLSNLSLQSNNSSLRVESSTLNLSGVANIGIGEVIVDNATLSGGSWSTLFGSLTFSGAQGNILDATTINGDLDLDRPGGSTVHLTNGARFTGTSRIGDTSFLWVDSDVTLEGVRIEIDGAFSGFEGVRVADGATLELDSASRVDMRSNGAALGLTSGGTIVNRGTISVNPNNTTGDRFYVNPQTLINYGTIDLNGPRVAIIGGVPRSGDAWTNELGGTIELDGAGVEFRGIGLNRGTITAVNASEILINGEWDNDGQVNLTNSELVIRADLTTADLGQVNATRTSSVVLERELDNRGATLDLTNQTGRYRLQGGSILGGTVAQTGIAPLGFASSTNSVLDGVEIRTNLDLSAQLSEVEFMNGATFARRANLGNGAKIGFSETISIDDATFTLNGDGSTRRGLIGVGGTNTLTLGPNTLVELLGGGSQMTSDLFQEGDGTIVNQGQITAGGRVSLAQRIDPDSFVNQGNLSLMPGIFNFGLTIGRNDRAWTNEATGSIVADASSLTFEGAGLNQGTIGVTDGRLLLTGSWRNEGTLEGANSTITLDGTFSTDDIGTLSLTNSSTLQLRGVLDNTGATLQLDTLGGLQGLEGQGGTILGGQIVQGLSAGLSSNLTLDGAFVQGDLDLSASNATMTLRNGAGFDGSTILGRDARLIYDDTGTLDGVTIDVNRGRLEVGNGQRLTLGADTVVELSGRGATIRNVSFQGVVESSLVNLGTIRADNNIDTSIATTNFENQGSVIADRFAALTVGSSESTWTNGSAGRILANDSTLRLAGAWTNRGTIELTGRSRLEAAVLGNERDGTLFLSGTVMGAIDNAGVFEVGGHRSTGQLQVSGDVVLRSTSILLFDVGATSNDLADITGTATLDGALAISVLTSAGEEILPEDVFVLADAAAGIAGAFSNVASGERLFASNGGGSFQVFYGEGSFLNQIVATNFVVPEPGTGLLLGIGLIAMGLRRRPR